VQLAEALGWDAERVNFIYRAGLLHDIGKLGVSNAILEKPGKLTRRRSPLFALTRATPSRFCAVSAHSRGWRRSQGRITSGSMGAATGKGALPSNSRLRCASSPSPMCSTRCARNAPTRPALPLEQVFEIMERDSGTALDGELVQILKSLPMDTAHARAA
jgi:hypothetical protein